MSKKILVVFVISILLCSSVIPTTSVFADVVIGDNNSIVVTQQGLENGKKIATMEALLQLLESGVSEINFNDISDLDDYLNEFYDELTNVNYQDVSNEILAGAYNDVKSLKQWIDDRGEYIATYYKDMLNSANQGLSDIFNRFNVKLEKGTLSRVPLDGVRGMSRFNSGGDTPSPPTDYNAYINEINNSGFWFRDFEQEYISGNPIYTHYPLSDYSWYGTQGFGKYSSSNVTIFEMAEIIDINIFSINDTYYVNIPVDVFGDAFNRYMTAANVRCYGGIINSNVTRIAGNSQYSPVSTPYRVINYSDSGTLEHIMQNLSGKFRNCNIYVDGVAWSVVGRTNPPTLDIDGFLTMYGNENPIEYEFPQGTQIDYNALYTTIYNAIRDNLPLDMQTINNNQVYYDSHDTVYSPTIYNYYGKDGDDENDWIDSILDYATIPDFNSVLGTVAVLDAPFINGITIVNAGVTDVIPSDILLIFGGFFVLVLFVCIINRMSK